MWGAVTRDRRRVEAVPVFSGGIVLDVLRLGRWQDALAGVECDALIVDAPYSARTHGGHDAVAGVGGHTRAITYEG